MMPGGKWLPVINSSPTTARPAAQAPPAPSSRLQPCSLNSPQTNPTISDVTVKETGTRDVLSPLSGCYFGDNVIFKDNTSAYFIEPEHSSGWKGPQTPQFQPWHCRDPSSSPGASGFGVSLGPSLALSQQAPSAPKEVLSGSEHLSVPEPCPGAVHGAEAAAQRRAQAAGSSPEPPPSRPHPSQGQSGQPRKQ